MVEALKQPKVLMLRSGGQEEQLLAGMRQCSEVTLVADIAEALGLLKTEQFDAVFLGSEDFLPLEQATVSRQAVDILNTLGEGVCLVGQDGTVLWANQQMASFGEAVADATAQRSQQAFEYFQERLAGQGAGELRPRKYSFRLESTDRHFEMIVTPMVDHRGQLARAAAVVWEETASRRLQQRINAIDNAGRELVRLDAKSLRGMTVEQRIKLVQDKVIRYARKLLHFDHFVVRLLNEQSNELEVLFGVGVSDAEHSEIFASIENNGITGYVAATGRSYICNNPASDARYRPGLVGEARSSLTVPLRLHDKVVGTMNVESDQAGSFSEDDRQIAEIFGRYIAIAMNILDLMVVERYQTSGQMADCFSEQISGPLDELMTEASLLMEDYIGHDGLRGRLGGLIDRIASMKQVVRDVHSGPKGLLGSARVQVADTGDLEGKEILVVDDEQSIRETIAGVARKHGLVVDTACDGRQAKALLAQRRYDLVLSDIKLPHGNGYQVFAAAREVAKDVPVILMTGFGYDPSHSIVRANKEGLCAVLYKPFKVDELIGEIRQALKEKSKPN